VLAPDALERPLIKLFTGWLLAAAQAEHEPRRPATAGG
jgi:hypothetical protein